MNARMTHPVYVLPDALQALQDLNAAAMSSGFPETTAQLMHLRVSQINGCSVCVDLHWREARKLGVEDERIFAVGAWREAPYFSDAERAAFDLAESVTRLSDRSDPVPDDVWDEAARHYDEKQLSGLLVSIVSINTWNRLNAATKQPAGQSWT